MNKTFTFLALAVAVIAVVISGYAARQADLSLGGQAFYEVPDFLQGIKVGTTRQLTVSNAGAVVTTGGLTLGSSGTAISNYTCYTNSSFNPGSISSSTAAATAAFLTPSASAGDIVTASLSSVTSTDSWYVTAKVTAGSGTATASTTLYLKGLDGVAVDLSTTTAKVCITR